jgi:hypothetical protein
MAMLGPKNYRFELRDPDFNCGEDMCEYLKPL